MQTESLHICDTYFHHEYTNNKIAFIRAFVVKKLEAQARCKISIRTYLLMASLKIELSFTKKRMIDK
jgi:hypothetical protein